VVFGSVPARHDQQGPDRTHPAFPIVPFGGMGVEQLTLGLGDGLELTRVGAQRGRIHRAEPIVADQGGGAPVGEPPGLVPAKRIGEPPLGVGSDSYHAYSLPYVHLFVT
jgi:hypothetical protein